MNVLYDSAVRSEACRGMHLIFAPQMGQKNNKPPSVITAFKYFEDAASLLTLRLFLFLSLDLATFQRKATHYTGWQHRVAARDKCLNL